MLPAKSQSANIQQLNSETMNHSVNKHRAEGLLFGAYTAWTVQLAAELYTLGISAYIVAMNIAAAQYLGFFTGMEAFGLLLPIFLLLCRVIQIVLLSRRQLRSRGILIWEGLRSGLGLTLLIHLSVQAAASRTQDKPLNVASLVLFSLYPFAGLIAGYLYIAHAKTSPRQEYKVPSQYTNQEEESKASPTLPTAATAV